MSISPTRRWNHPCRFPVFDPDRVAAEDQRKPERVPRAPVQLRPVAYGTPDRALAKGICQHLVDATPPTVIRFNPLTSARLRRVLRSFGIHA